ncbi:protein kinase domain-containing protein [Taibaiella helva]|uniref:protein kinase domain-containing protein n=1 Tax=Taibaiella helva TaxID=2301235 RepID=UPI000E574993|nr:protein kinase [Taibaiella helva]
MNINQQSAAYDLVGRKLKNDWTVIKRIEQPLGSTGGFFSVCYIVEREGVTAFLKALNFQSFFQMHPGRSIVQILNEQTNAYQFEKDLLTKCKNSRLSKISMILDEGEENIEGYIIGNVPYLIFEMAEGDIRSHLNFSRDVDVVWKLKSLHNVAVGLNQLHSVEIGHQDLKPSNILLYDNKELSKIGDLGRSLCRDIPAPHDDGNGFTGDINYAPPEFLYGYIEPNWNKRVKATDLYLFGSLIVFYFTGATMTSLISKNMNIDFRWDKWSGDYWDVKDYLINSFYVGIKEFKSCLSNKKLADELGTVLEYCCFPYPDKRGHPKNTTVSRNQYDFERIVSTFDLFMRRAKFTLIYN